MPPAVSSDHRTPPQLHHPQSPLVPPTTNHRYVTHSDLKRLRVYIVYNAKSLLQIILMKLT